MKRRILLIISAVTLSFDVGAQDSLSPAELLIQDFKVISEIYLSNMQPYIETAAAKQFPPVPDNASELDSATVKVRARICAGVHQTTAEKYMRDQLDHLIKTKGETYSAADRLSILKTMESVMKMQFLYLDYLFYENSAYQVRQRLKF